MDDAVVAEEIFFFLGGEENSIWWIRYHRKRGLGTLLKARERIRCPVEVLEAGLVPNELPK